MTANDSPSPRGSIPVEVLELCLDAFTLNHGPTRDAVFYQTLLACAISSRALLPRSRHHIYSDIRLSTPPTTRINSTDAIQKGNKTELLWNALTLNPSLAGCIRSLELIIRDPHATGPELLLILETLEKHLRMQASSPSAMPRQDSGPGLQELALTGDSRTIVWSDLHEAFRERISQLLLAPNSNSQDRGNITKVVGISCLRLSRLSAVPATLLSTANAPLRRLLLEKVFFASAEEHASLDPGTENGALSTVEDLTSSDCGARLHQAFHGKSPAAPMCFDGAMLLSRLTRLQVCATQRQDVEWGAAIVKANAGTLQTLEVGGFSLGQAQYASMLCSRVNLSSLPFLTRLVVTTIAVSTPTSPVCLLDLLDMFDFAREESSSSALTSVEINIRCVFRTHMPSFLDSISKPESEGGNLQGSKVDSIENEPEWPSGHRPESRRWRPTLASSSVLRKFQCLSDISINVNLGLALPSTDRKEHDTEGTLSARLERYLGDGIAPLRRTGVTARLNTEITLF